MSKQPKEQLPIVTLSRAIRGAKKGVMPPFSTEEFLEMLHLDGESPDNLTLMDRLLPGKSTIRGLRALVSTFRSVDRLLADTNNRVANPAQENIAHSLGAAVTKQVTRETEVCDGAASIAMACEREDIIPEALKVDIFCASRLGRDYIMNNVVIMELPDNPDTQA